MVHHQFQLRYTEIRCIFQTPQLWSGMNHGSYRLDGMNERAACTPKSPLTKLKRTVLLNTPRYPVILVDKRAEDSNEDFILYLALDFE